MIELDYKLDADELDPQDRHRLHLCKTEELQVGFCGRQIFIVNGVDLGGGSQGILNFASFLNALIGSFDRGDTEATFHDWDSPWQLYVNRDGDFVRITDSIGRGPVAVRLDELRNAIIPYIERVRSDFEILFPELKKNQTFYSLMNENSIS